MAVREFNGTTDQLVTATGACSGMTYGTGAALVKLASVTAYQGIGYLHDSGGLFVAAPLGLNNFGRWAVYSGAESFSASSATISTWYLLVVRKATGSATPRFSVYDYSGVTWSHGDGNAALGDWTAPGASGTVQFSYQAGTSDVLAGRIAARALWSNSLPWSADATGDSGIESSGLKDAASSWLSASPSAFWLFNQAATSTPVDDLSTTGTADQTSITGTTVVTGDDPPGFDFTLGGGSPQPTVCQSAQPWPPF